MGINLARNRSPLIELPFETGQWPVAHDLSALFNRVCVKRVP